MTRQELAKREDRAKTETFVLAQTESGFKVFSPASRGLSYEVTGLDEAPACTCPDFRGHNSDPAWRCKHILAVEQAFGGDGHGAEAPEPEPQEGSPAEKPTRRRRRSTNGRNGNGPACMTLKRSVSPDGRINSLSVEMPCQIEGASDTEIKTAALSALEIQDEIARSFLERSGVRTLKREEPPPPEAEPEPEPEPDESHSAQLLYVGGMDGKWGRRLFINVRVDDRVLRLFGSTKTLSEALATAGYPEKAKAVAEGVQLDLPCRVTTEPTPDGRYLNITKVLPASQGRRSQGARA